MFRFVSLLVVLALLAGCATNNMNALQKERIRAQLDAQAGGKSLYFD